MKNLKLLPPHHLSSVLSLLYSGCLTLIFLAIYSSEMVCAQAPDDMYPSTSSQDTRKDETKQRLAQNDAVLIEELEAIDLLEINISTVSQLITVNENKLAHISKEALDLNQSGSELEQFQKERKLLLSRLNDYKIQLSTLNEQKALLNEQENPGNETHELGKKVEIKE